MKQLVDHHCAPVNLAEVLQTGAKSVMGLAEMTLPMSQVARYPPVTPMFCPVVSWLLAAFENSTATD